MTFKVCSHSEWSSLHFPHGKAYHSHSHGDYDELNQALDQLNKISTNYPMPLTDGGVDFYINVIAPYGVYPIVSRTYSYEECVKLISQRRETRKLIAAMCVLEGMPGGNPCWISKKICNLSGN